MQFGQGSAPFPWVTTLLHLLVWPQIIVLHGSKLIIILSLISRKHPSKEENSLFPTIIKKIWVSFSLGPLESHAQARNHHCGQERPNIDCLRPTVAMNSGWLRLTRCTLNQRLMLIPPKPYCGRARRNTRSQPQIYRSQSISWLVSFHVTPSWSSIALPALKFCDITPYMVLS